MDSLKVKQLDWTKLLMWNGALFRFNKIIDFDSEITEITKIELIKVIEARSPNRGTIKVFKKGKPNSPLLASNVGVKGRRGIEVILVSSGKNEVLETADLIIG